MVKKIWEIGKNRIGCRVFVMALVTMLLFSMFVVLPVNTEGSRGGSKADMQTVVSCMDDAADGTRALYTNNTGVEGWVMFSPTRTLVFRGNPAQSTEYSWSAGAGGDPDYTEAGFVMDNLYTDASGEPWTYNSEVTIIYENATGYAGWTYCSNTSGTSPKELNEPLLRNIPVPTATKNVDNIDVSWSAMPLYVAGDFSYSPDAGTSVAQINDQFVGYLVYRAAKTGLSPVATWNDVASAGSVLTDISYWELVGGTETSPLTGTSWTDTSPPVGNYTYSIKLVFNRTAAAKVPTTWGSLGSNFVEISAPNNAPVLSGGGVAPDPGETTDTFTYNVTYTDADNDSPTSIVVHILKAGSGITGSPFTMAWQSGANDTGANYIHQKVGLEEGTDYTYKFNATDGTDYAAELPLTGPTVTAPAYQPQQIGISKSDTVYTPTSLETITADNTTTYYCWGYNDTATPAWYGLVSADWSVYSIDTGSGTFSVLTGSSTVFNATTVGDCTVNVTRTGVPDNWTATITITPGALKKVVITDIPNGIWVGAQSIPSGNTIGLNASGYDSDNNYVALAECTWTVTGGIGTVSPGTGTAATFTATTAGSGKVNADNATVAGSPDNSTGTIIVTVPYQPDLLLEGAGNNIYKTDATVTDSVQDQSEVLGAAGGYKKWEIKLENDGTVTSDIIVVDVFEEAKPVGWYWTLYNGTTNITGSLPYSIGLATGGSTTLYLNVTSPGTAGFGEGAIIRVNATSQGDNTQKDCVRTTTKIQAAEGAGWIEYWDYPSPASTELTYTISVKVYNNQSGSNTWTVKLKIDATTSDKLITIPGTSAGWANFTGITFTEGAHTLKVWVDDLGVTSEKTGSITAVTISAAPPSTSFEPTLIGIGIAVLVVAVLGTAVIWRKRKEKKKSEE